MDVRDVPQQELLAQMETKLEIPEKKRKEAKSILDAYLAKSWKRPQFGHYDQLMKEFRLEDITPFSY